MFFLYLEDYYGFLSRSTYFELILKIRRVVKDVRNATLLRRIDSNFKILKKTSKERIIRTFSCEKRVCAKRVDLKENIIYRTAFVESQIINFLQVIREHFPAKQNSFGEWNFLIPPFRLSFAIVQSCADTKPGVNNWARTESFAKKWNSHNSPLKEGYVLTDWKLQFLLFFSTLSLFLSFLVALKQKDIILPSKLLAC